MSRGAAKFVKRILLLVLFQVKSRMMGDSIYKGTVDCFFKTLKTEVCVIRVIFVFSSDIFCISNYSKLGS